MPPFEFHGGESHGGALLESALALPRQTFGGRYLYRTWDEKAGVLMRSLIKNHPLVDGNKRLAVATTFVFLLMNGRFLLVPNDEIVRFALKVAVSEPDIPWRTVAKWIRAHSPTVSDLRALLDKQAKCLPTEAPPDHQETIDSMAAWVEFFSEWAEKTKRIDRRLVATCRREGISIDDVWAAALEYLP